MLLFAGIFFENDVHRLPCGIIEYYQYKRREKKYGE